MPPPGERFTKSSFLWVYNLEKDPPSYPITRGHTHTVICYGPPINWSSRIPVDFVLQLQRASFINSNTSLCCKNSFSDLLLTFYNVFKLKALLGKLLVAAIRLSISPWNSYCISAAFFSITATFRGLQHRVRQFWTDLQPLSHKSSIAWTGKFPCFASHFVFTSKCVAMVGESPQKRTYLLEDGPLVVQPSPARWVS